MSNSKQWHKHKAGEWHKVNEDKLVEFNEHVAESGDIDTMKWINTDN